MDFTIVVLSICINIILVLIIIFSKKRINTLEDKIEDFKELNEKINISKSKIFSNISHGIRTPLNTIMGFSQAIIDENNINTIKEEAKDILTASDDLLDLVNDNIEFPTKERKDIIINHFKDLSHKKILIVDDNLLNIKVAKTLLKKYNPQIESIISGQECINKIIKGESYDLILLDDMMPNMTGTETLDKLKQIKDFKVPVIALTANAIEGIKEKYIREGFDDYVPKPIKLDELNRIINKYLIN